MREAAARAPTLSGHELFLHEHNSHITPIYVARTKKMRESVVNPNLGGMERYGVTCHAIMRERERERERERKLQPASQCRDKIPRKRSRSLL